MRKTVRGIDEQKIEGGGAFFKDEACGLYTMTDASEKR